MPPPRCRSQAQRQRAPGQHANGVPAVGGGAAHVVDRPGAPRDQLAEPRRHPLVQRPRGRPSPARRRRTPRPPGAEHGRPGRADAARHAPPSASSASANEQTAITIALRVPTFANCCGPPRPAPDTARSARPVPATLRFGPRKNSATGTGRAPRADSTSTVAPAANSGGNASPAGEDVARLPPSVPRLRICGEPTVRDAIASAGQHVGELGDHPGVGHAGADAHRAVVARPLRQLGHAR